MKIKPLFFFATVLFIPCCAKAGVPYPDNTTTTKGYYLAAGGSMYYLPIASLNAQLMSFGFSSGFGNAIGIGADYANHFSAPVGSSFTLNGTSLYSFHSILPQRIHSANDSLQDEMRGYHAQFDFFNFDFVNSENICFTAGLAWAFGRLKVTQTSSSGTTTYINPYFCPELRGEFHVRMGGHFYAGIRSTLQDDVTKTGWKESGVNAPGLTGTRLSETTVGAFIGWGN